MKEIYSPVLVLGSGAQCGFLGGTQGTPRVTRTDVHMDSTHDTRPPVMAMRSDGRHTFIRLMNPSGGWALMDTRARVFIRKAAFAGQSY